MTRERTRTIPSPVGGQTYFAPNGSGGDPTTWTASGPMLEKAGTYERIVDFNNGRLRPTSPVLHLKVKLSSVPVTNWSNSSFSGLGKGFLEAYPLLDVRQFADVITHQPLGELAIDAEKNILAKYASVAEGWSLLNNLLEIDDTLALIKKLQKYRRDPVPNRPGYLDWKFGVEPLYRDLYTLYSNVRGLKQRLRELRKNSGAKRRFSEKVSFRPDLPSPWPTDSFQGFAKITDSRIKGTARANGAITVSIPPLDSLGDNLKVILDVLGAHLDAVTVYDAIPFSWLLDWVLPIGDWLESMTDRRWIKPTVVFEQGSISYKIDATLTVRMIPEDGYPDWEEVDIGTVTIRKYERAPFQPTLRGKINGNFPAFNAPKLTPGKLAILGGLAKLI